MIIIVLTSDHVFDQEWPSLDDDQRAILSKPQKRLRKLLNLVYRLLRASIPPKKSALRVKTKVNKAPIQQTERVG